MQSYKPRDVHKKNLAWVRRGKKSVYQGRVHVVVHDVTLPNGEASTYELLHSDGCAVATLINIKGSILLTYQYRFPLDTWIYDLPGGGMRENGDPKEAAIRECREEIGIAPRKLEKLATFYPNPGRMDWPVHVFYCESIKQSKIELNDPSEQVERILMPVNELEQLIKNGEIVDPALLIGWYSARDKGYL